MGSTASSTLSTEMPGTGKTLACFANGCFWGTEHLFRRHFGDKLDRIRVGYTGGTVSNPSYRQVCSGSTGHAESIQITYNPEKLSYESLVEFFFAMHDPTTMNRQGADAGTQYRSAIFTYSDEQASIAKRVKEAVNAEHFAGKKIVTEITKAGPFFEGENHHQEYLTNNPGGYECAAHYLRWKPKI